METPTFLRTAKEVGIDDQQRADIVDTIAADPAQGDEVQGSGGVRKVPLTPEDDVARRWSCSSSHVRDPIREGQLPCFRLGGKLIRIKPEDVEAFEDREDTCRADPA